MDLASEEVFVFHAVMEALAGQHGQFQFGHVEPTGVFGGKVPLDTLAQTPCLVRREGLIERVRAVRVQVVLHENDLLGIGIDRLAHPAQEVRVVPSGAPLFDVDMALGREGLGRP